MAIAPAKLAERLIDWVRENRLPTNTAPVEITADTDLLTGGVLDSLGLIELITFIESHNGCHVDLSAATPDDLSTVNGLCRLALGKPVEG
jgi:acyl carrier protein